ncbi:MAG: hypothetical protein NVSMB56_09790 [Pyrinomonadaceae bacterium]
MLYKTQLERTTHYLRLSTGVAVIFFIVLVITNFALAVSAQQRQSLKTKTSDGQHDEVTSLLHNASALLQIGKLDEAEPLVRRAVRLAPYNPDAQNLLGVILDQRGQTQAAERTYREALRLNPKSISPLANLGVLLARTKRQSEAIQTFESVLKIAPEHPQATINLGLLYAARGDYRLALPLLERANALHPNTYAIVYNLGIALYSSNRPDEAAVALESASTLAPDEPEPLYDQGLIAAARGNSETALDFWHRTLARRPNFADANFMIGEELRNQNHY